MAHIHDVVGVDRIPRMKGGMNKGRRAGCHGRGQAMIEIVQLFGLGSAIMSCVFWLTGAGVRFRPFSIFRLRGPESIPAALQRQSLFNALAAIFAAGAAGAQALVFYLQLQQ